MNTGKKQPTPAQVEAMRMANKKMFDAVKANPSSFATPFLLFWLEGGLPGTMYAGTQIQNGINEGMPNWAK